MSAELIHDGAVSTLPNLNENGFRKLTTEHEAENAQHYLSELITILQKIKNEHGDIPVKYWDQDRTVTANYGDDAWMTQVRNGYLYFGGFHVNGDTFARDEVIDETNIEQFGESEQPDMIIHNRKVFEKEPEETNDEEVSPAELNNFNSAVQQHHGYVSQMVRHFEAPTITSSLNSMELHDSEANHNYGNRGSPMN